MFLNKLKESYRKIGGTRIIFSLFLLSLVCIAIGGYRTLRQNKLLTISLMRNDSLLGEESFISIKDRIEIQYEGKLVGNLSFVELSIENSGNRSIRKLDFDEPITLKFPQGTVVGNVRSSPHSTFELDHQINSNEIMLKPALFNKGDLVVLQILLINAPPDILKDTEISGRIDEVYEKLTLKPVESPGIAIDIFLFSGILIAIVVVGFYFIKLYFVIGR